MKTFETEKGYTGPQTIVQRERLLLAPYAQFSEHTKGRKYPEEEHPYRGPFQRDRDRILHSAAYRRLADKTQVFTGMGDYHRTRLTHTHEVASIARTISRWLRLNEDLTEALALVHDIGHPPFGHAGEDALAECLADDGGFSHNAYALTIIEELEVRHRQFPGLNLTAEVLESQQTRIDKSAPGSSPLLEAQVVDTADSITYDAHDTDDAVKLGLVELDELMELDLVRECVERIRRRGEDLDARQLRKALVHELIDFQVTAVLEESSRQLNDAQLSSADAARCLARIIKPPESIAAKKRELEGFLYHRVYRHEQIVSVRTDAQNQLKNMFAMLCSHPEELPARYQQRAEKVGISRAVGDYLAGMTDRFFQQRYAETVGQIN